MASPLSISLFLALMSARCTVFCLLSQMRVGICLQGELLGLRLYKLGLMMFQSQLHHVLYAGLTWDGKKKQLNIPASGCVESVPKLALGFELLEQQLSGLHSPGKTALCTWGGGRCAGSMLLHTRFWKPPSTVFRTIKRYCLRALLLIQRINLFKKR